MSLDPEDNDNDGDDDDDSDNDDGHEDDEDDDGDDDDNDDNDQHMDRGRFGSDPRWVHHRNSLPYGDDEDNDNDGDDDDDSDNDDGHDRPCNITCDSWYIMVVLLVRLGLGVITAKGVTDLVRLKK